MQINSQRTSDIARGRWTQILSVLGIDVNYLKNKHGPCPTCHGKDRFRFDDKEGRGTWFCSHCGAGDGFSLLQTVFGWGFIQAAKEVDRVVSTIRIQPGVIRRERTDEEKLKAISMVLQQSKKVTDNDAVFKYLVKRKILAYPIPSDIRCHDNLKHSSGNSYPAMLAIVRDQAGNGVTVLRTYLDGIGHKAPVSPSKQYMQSIRTLNGSSVQLSGVEEHLGIAEGIETALAARQIFNIPTWAATNAVLLAAWEPPIGVKKITIFGDNDANFTGQEAAYSLARRLIKLDLKVDVRIPQKINTDWADQE